ncbi:hypothetical protein V6N12_053549 [Hibiscus sabdariffa]|uniref:RRM domain-containing protein n=1 Tax=Hibiscus sabdariffa TaxID=183260 RepID=A0ABR2D7X3_9ROSI
MERFHRSSSRVVSSRVQRANRWGYGKQVQSQRAGVSVFVDFISKRIHRATLREAFAGYGKVVDTYIAYNNPGRQKRRYTFAFIRFSNREEALKAVELSNNRRMDGFTIKVFLGNNQAKSIKMGGATVTNKPSIPNLNKKEYCKFTNGRSYKKVLLKENIMEGNGSDFVIPLVESGVNHDRVKPVADPYHFSIPVKELAWMDCCLVGQIKGMYDADFVEQALISDGFRVKKNRFDNARILLGLKCMSDVPSGVCVFINGISYQIKISVSCYEDERCWIDADQTKSHKDVQLEEECDEEDRCRQEDFVPKNHEKTAESSPKKVEYLGNSHLFEETCDKEAFLPSEGLYTDVSLGSDKLVEIPIVSGSESTKASSGASGPFTPVLDKETGLFSIKPKCLKAQSSWGPNIFRRELNESQARISPTLVFGKTLQRKRKVTISKSKPLTEPRNGTSKFNPVETEGVSSSSEAQNALEIAI